MAFKKKTGGRKPGVPNRVPAALKEMILQALELEGGVEYIREQARNEPVAFMSMLGRVLPLTVNGTMDGKLTVTWEK